MRLLQNEFAAQHTPEGCIRQTRAPSAIRPRHCQRRGYRKRWRAFSSLGRLSATAGFLAIAFTGWMI
jgi:hypothetical protein